MMSLRLLLLLHPWRCIGESSIALISFGRGWRSKPPQRLPLDTTLERATCPCLGGPFHELDTPKCEGKSHTPHNACTTGTRSCDIGHTHKVVPNEPVSGDEELDVLSNPLLASPPGKEVKKKEVQSSNSEVDLFAPPPTAPVP